MHPIRSEGPVAVKKLLEGREPFALLDVREQEEFSRAHILLASCAPCSRIEFMVEKLVPCKTVPVILVDGGDEGECSRAKRAAEALQALGYTELIILEGGFPAWKAAGFVEVNGVGALSKGFGEYIESVRETPRLTPEEVKALIDSGEDVVVIDVRPREEYGNMNIPGGRNAPGCEVTYRFLDLVPNPKTKVIVNCAGRTRSIIGTQTLINAGVPNSVSALKGGTMNWQLSGFTLEYKSPRRTSPPSAEAIAFAREHAADVAKRFDVKFVDADTVRRWQSEAKDHPLYVFDVRQPEEYLAGHLPGSRSAPGGQLVQATDEYAAVRGARFVLVDDTEARAIMTAHWLNQMGLPDVHVLKGGLGGSGLGAEGLDYGTESPSLPTLPEGSSAFLGVSAKELHEVLHNGDNPLIVNVGLSNKHKQGHVPGAVWVPRGYLHLAHKVYPDAKKIVVTADIPEQAALAALDGAKLWKGAAVGWFKDDLAALEAFGETLETGMPTALAAEDDIWYKPYTDINASPEAMAGYFSWEFGLVERIEKDGCVRFWA